jgi:hypothetical protein
MDAASSAAQPGVADAGRAAALALRSVAVMRPW